MSLLQSNYPYDPELSQLVDYNIHIKKWIIKQGATATQKTELLNLIANTEDILRKRFHSRYQKAEVIIE